MKELKPNSLADYIGAAFLFVIFFSGTAIVWNITHPEVARPQNERVVIECPSDIESYSKVENKLSLLENKPSSVIDGVVKGYKVTIKRSGLTDDIACGYILYQVSFGGNPIEQEYMALNMKPFGSQFGGHLWPDENRGAIIKEIDNKTQVILPLDTITHDGTTKQPIRQANWAAVLNVADEIEFQVGLSAAVPNGNIDLLQIAYKCKNKETGNEGDACLMEVIKVEPFDF